MKTKIETITDKVHGGWPCAGTGIESSMANNPGKWYWCKGCKQWIRVVRDQFTPEIHSGVEQKEQNANRQNRYSHKLGGYQA